jgi:hypothetical protein
MLRNMINNIIKRTLTLRRMAASMGQMRILGGASAASKDLEKCAEGEIVTKQRRLYLPSFLWRIVVVAGIQ